MAWATPQYTKTQVDKAGHVLLDPRVSPLDLDDALEVITNWRSSHSFPLNTFQVTLRRKAKQVDPENLVAQRIKRLSSIEHKLSRFPTMKLSQMQDIGGCRAVVRTVRRVDDLRTIYRKSDLKHHLLREDDYIRHPKTSGYRGIHLIYRYLSDKKHTYNGLQIEMQFRSKLQHAWATAVETVGTFLQQALKSSQGHDRWLRFFSLMGSAIALRERTPRVPDTPSSEAELLRELKHAVRELDVQKRLAAYGAALRTLQDPSAEGARYFLLALEPSAGFVNIKGYGFGELDRAATEYLEVERSIKGKPGAEAVLVSVESLESLRRAYPNYFLDTRVFIDAVKAAINT